jgi:hypothetical protein
MRPDRPRVKFRANTIAVPASVIAACDRFVPPRDKTSTGVGRHLDGLPLFDANSDASNLGQRSVRLSAHRQSVIPH